MAFNDDSSVACTERAGDRHLSIEEIDVLTDPTEGGNLLDELVASAGVVDPSELVPAMLNQRAAIMFTEGDGAPRASGKDPLVKDITLKLLKLARQAVLELFERHCQAVQANWGTAIDMEEALGYLICDTLRVEVLAAEARAIGKRANHHLKSAKTDDEKLKKNASARRSKVNKAAEKAGPERAKEFEDKIEAIDTSLAQQRAAHWAKTVDLEIPTAPLVETPRPTPPPPPSPVDLAAHELKQAEQALATAEAAATAADGEHRQAARALGKLQPPGFAGAKRTSADIKYFFGAGLSDEVYAWRQAELDILLAAEQRVCAAECAQRGAARDVKHAGMEVEWARDEATRVQQQQQRAAERAERAAERAAEQAAFDAEQAERQRERETANAELDARTASTEEMLSRHKSRIAELERESRAAREELVRSEWYYHRAEVVNRDAENVWGAGWKDQEPVAPTVYRLVGLSADEIRNVAPCVSQTSTSIDERARLNRLHKSPLEY